MTGIFGVLNRDGGPVDPGLLQGMAHAIHAWEVECDTPVLSGPCGLGRARLAGFQPLIDGQFPRWVSEPGFAFAAGGRVDGRKEACDLLEVPWSEGASLPDADLLLRAYQRWGETCVDRLAGEWVFAAWHPADRRLFLARDALSTAALYYFADDRHVAFAPSPKCLLAMPFVPRSIDEVHLARVLTSWPAITDSTIFSAIRALRPGRTLTVTPESIDERRYWNPRQAAPVRLAKDDDYVDAFLEVFTRAVEDRLRLPGGVAVSLSGGLDSGSVAAIAARRLREQGRTLVALTHVPRHEFDAGDGIGDERGFARATADAVGIDRLVLLDGAGTLPVDGIRRSLEIHESPAHAADNQYWMLDVLRHARLDGGRTLMSGQFGNQTISWGQRSTGRRARVRALAGWLVRSAVRSIRPHAPAWERYSAINPRFAERLGLRERMAAEGHDPGFRPPRTALERRARFLDLADGRPTAFGAAHGVAVVDPTLDLRVVRFTLGLPERQFVAPDGTERWLIRRAMSRMLPPDVLSNTRRGRQSADLVGRLRADAGEVERALDACEACPACHEYLDLGRMREQWRLARTLADRPTRARAGSILVRGLMAGLFLVRRSSG